MVSYTGPRCRAGRGGIMKKAVLWVTAVVFVGKVLFAMANISQGVLLSDFIHTFSLEMAWQGAPNAATNIGVLIAMLFSVPLAAKLGKLWLFAGAVFGISLMLAFIGAAGSAPMLIAGYALVGFAFGALDTTASSIVADLHRGPRAPMMMGILHAAYGTGGILAPIWMTSALEAGATWRAVLFVLSGAMLIAFAACAFVFGRAKDVLPKKAAPDDRLTASALRAFAQKPGNVTIMLCAACYCAHQVSIYLWISRVIGEGYGNVAMGAAALSLFWVGTVLSRLLVPLLRVNTVHYVRFCMPGAAVILLVCAALGGPVPALIASALSGLLGGATLPMLLSEITRRNEGRSMLSVTAVLVTTGLSAIVCAPLIGYVVGVTSLGAVLFVSGAFAVLCSLNGFALKAVK